MASGEVQLTALSFRLGSIPVRVHLGFFALPLLWGLGLGPAKLALLVFVVSGSVLVHELGHALVMRAFGHAPAIELIMMGGLTHYPPTARPGPGEQLLTSLAGPFAGLALALFSFICVQLDLGRAEVRWALEVSAGINLFWSLINLLPILPWDGGNSLDAGLALVTGRRQPNIVAATSIIVALGVMFVAIPAQQPLLAYFAMTGVFRGWQHWRVARVMEAVRGAWAAIHARQFEAATRLVDEALATTNDPMLQASLLDARAWARLHAQDFVGARASIAKLEGFVPSPELAARLAAADNDAVGVVTHLWPQATQRALTAEAFPLLVSALLASGRPAQIVELAQLTAGPREKAMAAEQLFQANEFEHALAVSQQAFTATRLPLFAFNAACALCKLARLHEAIVWLNHAIDAGYANVTALANDRDLDPLRAREDFAALVARVPQP